MTRRDMAQLSQLETTTRPTQVSVIMPSFNHAAFIREAIDSILQQSYQNWELIISDDGSEDESLEIIDQYTKRHPAKIRLVRHPNGQHCGIAQTYLRAIKSAQGSYIAFLESDDIWQKEALALKVQALAQHRQAILVHTDVELFGEALPFKDSMEHYCQEITRRQERTKPYRALDSMLLNLIPTFSCVMVRAEYLVGLNFQIKEQYAKWLDRWLWTQLAVKGLFVYIPRQLTHWRFHSDSYNSQKQRSISNTLLPARDFNKELHAMIWEELRKKRDGIMMLRLAGHSFYRRYF